MTNSPSVRRFVLLGLLFGLSAFVAADSTLQRSTGARAPRGCLGLRGVYNAGPPRLYATGMVATPGISSGGIFRSCFWAKSVLTVAFLEGTEAEKSQVMTWAQ